MAGGRARSPSPSDHSSSKRAKYDDYRSERRSDRDKDRDYERSRSSRHQDDDRRRRDDHRSSRRHDDRDDYERASTSRSGARRERDLSPAVSVSSDRSKHRSHRSDRGRERERDRDRDRDRDRERSDRDRYRDRYAEDERTERHRDSESSRHHSRSGRQAARDDDDNNEYKYRRSLRENGDHTIESSSPRRETERPSTEKDTARLRRRTASPQAAQPSTKSNIVAESSNTLSNGHKEAPRAPPASKPAPTPSETPEQKKQRELEEKKKRLEAWKAQKAAQKAAAAPAPAPNNTSVSTEAPSSVSDGTALKSVTKPVTKPAAKITPKSSTGTSAGPKLALKSGGISIAGGANASSNTQGRAKAANFMGGDDEESASTAQPTMFKPDEVTHEEIAQDHGGEHEEDESDDEDLVGDNEGDERAMAEERRERAMLQQAGLAEEQSQNQPESEQVDKTDDVDMAEASVTAVTDVEAEATKAAQKAAGSKKAAAMEIDTKEAGQDEDEEIDPLDAYMSEVQQEAKTIDLADLSRGTSSVDDGTKNRAIKLSASDVDGVIEDDEDAKADQELDPMNMTTAEIMAAAAKKAKKKELANVDHSKIQYEPFRKAFYHPPREIEELTEEDAELMRLQLDGIKIRGVDCPKPVTKWSYCGLPAVVLDVIKSLNYTAPTSIQTQAIPAIMSGRDVIGVAKTGSGKTIAFLLPLFRHIKDQRPLEPLEGPIAMIMTPTRELATQIYKECKPFLKVLNLRATCLYGGSPLKDNIAELKRGVEIVVCTPGRMIELLSTNSGKIISMRRITYLVMDEADRMFDLGFEPQVSKIIQQIRPDRQTVLFSATFPKQMEALARKVLKKPLEITVGGRSVVAPEIEQVVEVREEETKFVRLLEILGRYSNEDADALVLIFVDRHESADDLLKELMGHHYVCQSLHGGKDQVDRDQTLSDFKAGVVPIVIATSVAARGLDVKQLKLVINYDAPNHMEDYVHRAGRTGRAGNKGTCITFITPEQEKYSVDLYRALDASGVTPPGPLKEMAEAFMAKVKSGKAGLAGSGFGGKGLDRFDKDREATRKAERTAYGGPGGEDNAAKEEGEEDEEGASGAAGKGGAAAASSNSKVQELKVEIKRGPAPDMSRSGLSYLPPVDRKNDPEAVPAPKAETPATPTEALAKAEKEAIRTGKPLSALDRLKLVQASLNASLKQRRNDHNLNYDESRMETLPSGADFHAIIPINDYPQKARWRVTNKEITSALTEETGASVTNKGIYYPPGRDPTEADPPKLSLLIEANDEIKVKMAIQQIKKILFDTTTQAMEAETRASISGRYTL